MAQRKYDDSSIKFLSVCEQIRLRPQMWGFNTASIEGLLIQLKEIIDNSADEALDRNKIYPIDVTFFVSKDKKTYQVLIQDHGSGIPVGTIDKIFVGGFSSGKYEGTYGGASTGSNGIGSKAVSVFSKLFLAFTKRPDGFGYVKIEQGRVKDSHQQRKAIDKDESTVGTTVLFQPDAEAFACIENMFGEPPTGAQVNGYTTFMSRVINYPLFRQNLTMTVRLVQGLLNTSQLNKSPVDLWRYLITPGNFKSEIVFQSDPGLTPRIYVTKTHNLREPIWELGRITKDSENSDDPLSYDIDIFLDEKSARGNNAFVAAVNYTPIIHPESSHILILQNVLKDFLEDNLDDGDARAFFESKYTIPISGGISAGWVNAAFIGQDKSRFENRQFSDYYRSNLRKVFRKITEEKGEVIWDNLWDLIKENFDAEYAKFSKRSLGLGKSSKNLTYELIRQDSYRNCKSGNNEVTELFITEGDSAAGRVQTVRDEDTQAMFILSGKPQNAIRIKDRSKLEKNAIFSDLSRILNVSPTDKTLDNMRFRRILIMTDADADGYHIVALLIGIFYRINPRILEEGRVAVTNPPLFAIKFNNKTAYLRDENALRDVKVTWYRTLFDIDVSTDYGKTAKNLNHGHMFMETTLADGTKVHRLNKNHDEFRNLCMIVDHIGTIVEHQADLLNIDPGLLEQLLHCVDYLDEHNVDVKKIKNTLVGCDDVIWDRENNVLILVDIQGVEYRVPLAKLQSVLKGQILPWYEKAHWRNFNIFITTKYTDRYCGTPCTFMMLYQIFKDVADICKITRFKGLGEMNEQAIDMTCVNKATRCFTIIKGVGDVDRLYKMLDVDTEARKKLINNNYLD